jgi:glycerol uptake facilitator-like aquaporin
MKRPDEHQYHDVTQPTAKDRSLQLFLAVIVLAISPILFVVNVVLAVAASSADKNPGGLIFIACIFGLATVFGVVRFRGLRGAKLARDSKD